MCLQNNFDSSFDIPDVLINKINMWFFFPPIPINFHLPQHLWQGVSDLKTGKAFTVTGLGCCILLLWDNF